MTFIYHGPTVKTDDLPLICDDEWHDLDVGSGAPDAASAMFAHVYLNVERGYDPDPIYGETACTNCGATYTTKVPGIGRLRIRMVREAWDNEPDDPTYYYDIPLVHGRGTIDTRSMFELAEANRPQHWEYRVTDAKGVIVTTRFIKFVEIPGRLFL